jgi:entericidin A
MRDQWRSNPVASSFSRAGMMKRLLSLVALFLLTATLLAGCNTARGFGEDIKHLGNSISHAAS